MHSQIWHRYIGDLAYTNAYPLFAVVTLLSFITKRSDRVGKFVSPCKCLIRIVNHPDIINRTRSRLT